MPFSFTNPLGIVSAGLGGLAEFGSDILDIGTGLFAEAAPLLGFLGDVGVFGDRPAATAAVQQRPTSPATPQAVSASMLPAVIPPIAGAAGRLLPALTGPTARGVGIGALAGELVEGVAEFFGGGEEVPNGNGEVCIRPVTSPVARWPRTVQFMVRTPSGNTRVKTYRDMGAPVLYRGDLSAVKRVKRARRLVGS